jgi:hypothetical protein
MKKYFFFAAVAIGMLASCADNEYVGEVSPNQNPGTNSSDAIVFSSGTKGLTRADIYGPSAADLLGNHFYVTGTKGEEEDNYPTSTLVFDNYLVHFGSNTAGTTESNTANWEYVGVTPGSGDDADYVKLSSLNSQTIKYWDYSADQYDFFAFSTGKNMKAVAYADIDQDNPATDEIGVTGMQYGTGLNVDPTVPVAYKFFIPSADAIKKIFITDITEVAPANYGQEVTLKFKNLGAKVRVALYETIPGYSVKDVVFYTEDGTTDFDDDKSTSLEGAVLISANASGLPTRGTIEVRFQHVGNTYDGAEDYNKATTNVTPIAASSETYTSFGALSKFAAAEDDEDDTDEIYLGRSLPNATFAGDESADYYQTVFPVSDSDPLTLRVDYTLVSTDGSGEEIKVYGAKAVVPSTYTVWLPNYAYTYIFKISDNTNGWTDPNGTANQGLFPITFDAVVAEATDATGEQTTITTVATPSITTYQQGHTYATDEYSIATGKNIYVQVMDNSAVSATLVTTLSATNSLLYAIDDDDYPIDATEAAVMDALEKRSSETTSGTTTVITGRNGIVLTSNDNIDNTVEEIVNGVDDNVIEVNEGEAAEIDITALSEGTYAYVYDYTTGTKTYKEIYQPITTSTTSAIGASGKYFIAIDDLANYDDETPGHYSTAGAPEDGYIYFSVTKNGGSTKTYSFVSVDSKTTLPAGLLKVPVGNLTEVDDNTANAAADTFYFDKYIRNNGKYAVKVIKIVA